MFKTDIAVSSRYLCVYIHRVVSRIRSAQTVAVRFSCVVRASERIFITRKKKWGLVSGDCILLPNVEHGHALCHPLWRLVAINCLMFYARTGTFPPNAGRGGGRDGVCFRKLFFPKAHTYEFTSDKIHFYVEAFCLARVWMHS